MVETEGNKMATKLQDKVDEYTKFLVEKNGYPYALGSVSVMLAMAANRTEEQLIESIDFTMKYIEENFRG
jgi:hypothetical protein